MEKLKTLPILFLCVLSVGCAATSATPTRDKDYYDSPYEPSKLSKMFASRNDMVEVCESFGSQMHCSMMPKSQAGDEIERAINSMMMRIGR